MENYSMLLVDDEELALLGIEQGVDWEALGITKKYRARSMKEALEVVRRHAVDIMISDIEMPGGSGLELIRQVRSEFPEVICIFYTCHAEFSYCQEAVRLGALDYVLKPIPYDELEEIIRKGLMTVKKGKAAKELEELWGEFTKSDEKVSPVETVKKTIMEHLSEDISRNELAKMVYMSPDYLTKMFKKETGMSLSEYIISKRILLAKQLLKSTDLSIASIADKAGFSYSSYFTKIFRAKTGMTPQQYRNNKGVSDENGKE